jgi:hypothetical protein
MLKLLLVAIMVALNAAVPASASVLAAPYPLPSGEIVGRTCRGGADLDGVTRHVVNGIKVDVECGDQFLVTTSGRCLVLGPNIIEVRCTFPR